MCSAGQHAHHQSYSDGFGAHGAQTMVVEVHAGLVHVPDEIGGRYHTHQLAGLQVQLLLSDVEEFLCVCIENRNEIRFRFWSALAPL